ncbi:MAG: CCA tRNA nucleotidyltransferase [Pseudomonadota bacterium]
MQIEADWLTAAATQSVISALEAVQPNGTRFVGGCIRNTIMGRPVDDIDLASKLVPDQVSAALENAGIRAIPTGVDHGTVTAVCDHQPFEITTLRRDIETDGRRAVIAFSTDWAEDAQRRDFRLNALYADRLGRVFDPIGEGISDARSGDVVFIGSPDQRLKEDYLRILRFFRFNAWYGQRLDPVGLAACERQAAGLDRIASERIWRELVKLYAAPAPDKVTYAMVEAGILAQLLGDAILSPERIETLIALETALALEADPLQRLMALIPREPEVIFAMAERLRLSNRERDRLLAWVDPDLLDLGAQDDATIKTGLYRFGAQAVLDRSLIAAIDHNQAPSQTMLGLCKTWQAPDFPLGGADALAAGLKGPQIGAALRRVEQAWLDSGMALSRDALLQLLRA